MSNWKLKRAQHRGPRQSSQRPITITIVAATKTGPARRGKKQPLQSLSQRYWLQDGDGGGVQVVADQAEVQSHPCRRRSARLIRAATMPGRMVR
jgi:hypothetical protein